MAKLTIVFGVLLTLIGLAGYVFWEPLGASKQSWTALIPAFAGVPLLVLGALTAARPDWRIHTMHAAAAVGLLGFVAAAGGFASRVGKAGLNAGTGSMLLMAALCGTFVALCVKSFIDARRQRKAAEPVSP